MDLTRAKRLLDVAEMTPVLAELPVFSGKSLSEVELLVSWVKPGRHFNAHYRVSTQADGDDSGQFAVSAFVVEPARGRRTVAKAGEHSCASGGGDSRCRRCTNTFVEPDLLLQQFPWDYRLPSLRRCLEPRRVNRAWGGGRELKGCRVIAYRPGMRCQIAYNGVDGSMVYGKVAVEKRGRGYTYQTQCDLYEAIQSAGVNLRIPRPLAYLEDLELALVEAGEGVSMGDLIDDGADCRQAMLTVAGAAAELHDIDTSITERTYTVANELDLLETWTSLCSQIFPHLRADLTAAHDCLRKAAPPVIAPGAVLHRDFYDKQILLGQGPPTLLDMDTACVGDAELDIGNFCAHLLLRGVQEGDPERYRRWHDDFVGAYPRGLDASRLMWYQRASLLRLACYYALRPRWLHIAPALISASVDES